MDKQKTIRVLAVADSGHEIGYVIQNVETGQYMIHVDSAAKNIGKAALPLYNFLMRIKESGALDKPIAAKVEA